MQCHSRLHHLYFIRWSVIMAPLLGYWNIRGICEPIRFVLAYVEQKYDQKLYDIKNIPMDDDDYSAWDDWYSVKYEQGLELPNLPYYRDCDYESTQSCAILRYLAEKHNLAPTTAEEKRRVYMVEGQIMDMRMQLDLTVFSWGDRSKKLKEDHEKYTPIALKTYSEFLGNNKWLAGDKLTYVDFMFYEFVLYHHSIFLPGCLDKHDNLKEFMRRFESLPQIAKYMQTDFFKKLTLYGPIGKINDPVKYTSPLGS